MKLAYQGTKNSTKATFDSAKALATGIGGHFRNWEIDDEVRSYSTKIEKAIGRQLSWEKDDIAMQNIQARARSPIIWMLTNLDKFLLLSTGNRSEGSVGYTTMDGDASGSLSPIAALDKQMILDWLKYAESQLGIKALHQVNQLQPSAELRPSETNQTDEEDLMPYPALVAIERLAIKERKCPKEVFDHLNGQYSIADLKNWIKKFFTLWSVNQWKRERFAPSFHLDDFNIDPKTWCRFPILSSGFDEELKELELL